MTQPLVSIIVRTCGRPAVLSNALKSIRSQSYSNIEVVIVEDGAKISEHFIEENFSDLNYRYFALESHLGRCRAGNYGMQNAHGIYLNFLDDDDLFLPDHVAELVNKLENSGKLAAYAMAEEHQIKNGRIRRKFVRYKQPYNKILLCYMNYIPIQSIMFSRKLYEEFGGLNEQLEALEDWDLWVRYSMHCDFLFVPVVSSIYHTPYKGKIKRKRTMVLHQAEASMECLRKSYLLTMDVKQVNQEMDYILNVFNRKGIFFYIQKIRNFILYRDI